MKKNIKVREISVTMMDNGKYKHALRVFAEYTLMIDMKVYIEYNINTNVYNVYVGYMAAHKVILENCSKVEAWDRLLSIKHSEVLDIIKDIRRMEYLASLES